VNGEVHPAYKSPTRIRFVFADLCRSPTTSRNSGDPKNSFACATRELDDGILFGAQSPSYLHDIAGFARDDMKYAGIRPSSDQRTAINLVLASAKPPAALRARARAREGMASHGSALISRRLKKSCYGRCSRELAAWVEHALLDDLSRLQE